MDVLLIPAGECQSPKRTPDFAEIFFELKSSLEYFQILPAFQQQKESFRFLMVPSIVPEDRSNAAIKIRIVACL
jgi:hypothetical protein